MIILTILWVGAMALAVHLTLSTHTYTHLSSAERKGAYSKL
jgi:hypothetical protein